MAWDPPAAFSVSEVVTAAKMNQIRDSLLYIKGGAGVISLDNHLLLNGAYELRIGADGVLYRGGSSQLRSPNALVLDSGLYANGHGASSTVAFGVSQASNKMIYVGAQGITSSTVTLMTGVVRGVGGTISAYGSTFGWSTIAANAALGLAAASFNAGAFVVEVTGGGVLQARRVSGSETWDVSCILNVR